MVINVAGALSAYSKNGGLTDTPSDVAGAGSTVGGQSFGDVLKNFTGDAIQSLQSGETAAAQSATSTGKADLPSIVTAIDNAEVILEEITTIRDKAISAYQTITGSAI